MKPKDFYTDTLVTFTHENGDRDLSMVVLKDIQDTFDQWSHVDSALSGGLAEHFPSAVDEKQMSKVIDHNRISAMEHSFKVSEFADFVDEIITMAKNKKDPMPFVPRI